MDSDPQEDENVAETLCTKDDEKSGDINKLVGEPTKTIGCHEIKFALKFTEFSWFKTPFSLMFKCLDFLS